MPGVPVTVVELPQFLRQAADVWDKEERSDFVDFIARNPEAGDVIPGTGGIRKIRWSRRGTGKRGGVRVVYFYHSRAVPIYLLAIYAKSMRKDLSPSEKAALTEFAARLKRAARA